MSGLQTKGNLEPMARNVRGKPVEKGKGNKYGDLREKKADNNNTGIRRGEREEGVTLPKNDPVSPTAKVVPVLKYLGTQRHT